jgi:hypothetical protein
MSQPNEVPERKAFESYLIKIFEFDYYLLYIKLLELEDDMEGILLIRLFLFPSKSQIYNTF